MKRYGAGELYGNAIATLLADMVRTLAASRNRDITCPFKPGTQACHKRGGVCTLIAFEKDADDIVTLSDELVTTCPSRFLEGNRVFGWVGETLLETQTPYVVREVPFLMAGGEEEEHDEVGRIHMVLVKLEGDLIRWCALEMQAVYFSGASMEREWDVQRFRLSNSRMEIWTS